jgi:hypothetical protein
VLLSTFTLLLFSGILLIVSAFSSRVAALFRLPAMVALLGAFVAVEPMLIFGTFFMAVMSAGGSGHGSVISTLISFFIIPALSPILTVLAILSLYAVSRNTHVSTKAKAFGFVAVLFLGLLTYGGAILYLQHQSVLHATIDQTTLTSNSVFPTLAGTFSGEGEMCVKIVKSTFKVGTTMSLHMYNNDPNLLYEDCPVNNSLNNPVYDSVYSGIVAHGRWSEKVPRQGYHSVSFSPGNYTVVITNFTTSEVLARGQLIVTKSGTN